MVKISYENTKIGKVMNVSLPPISTCLPDAPCADACYAMKAWKMYNNTRNAWGSNLELYLENPGEYCRDIVAEVRKREPELFRWHVGGDIPDMNYLHIVVMIAEYCLDTKTEFLIFTKRYDFVNALEPFHKPENLTIVFSGWPGLEMDNPNDYPVAWLKDAKEVPSPIPNHAFKCSGKCDECRHCWSLLKGDHVYFERH